MFNLLSNITSGFIFSFALKSVKPEGGDAGRFGHIALLVRACLEPTTIIEPIILLLVMLYSRSILFIITSVNNL